ncbi:MAG: xylose isomerase [Phycisphaerales bacterium]
MTTEHFKNISRIEFQGVSSKNNLGFRQYDADDIVEGRSMRSHLRFAACYWHTMRNGLSDPFGAATALTPWDDGTHSITNAKTRANAFFEFMQKCQIEYWCFHDRDLAPEGDSIAESEKNLDALVGHVLSLQQQTGVKLLWGTANLFSHPQYMHGAATSPSVDSFLCAAAQVRKALEVTLTLGGSSYVFWGGREGYTTLLNTDLAREREHLARFLHLAADYAQQIGFTGALLIEPKPHEPTTHQYDSNAEATLNFLREFNLFGKFKLNIETNHATLAGHSMEHELSVAIAANSLGSIDANMGTPGLGWDTDRFPTDLYLTTHVMLAVLGMGGFQAGGLNFDAKRRRESFEPIDLFYSHIAGMDSFAFGLKAAARIRADGRFAQFIQDRYASWSTPLGIEVASGKYTLSECAQLASKISQPSLVSGRQEMLEAILNEIILQRV